MHESNLRHHDISLCGLTPASARVAELHFYAPGQSPAERFALSGPVAKPIRSERITVTADQCHNGEYWSLEMLAKHVTELGKGHCMVSFLPAAA